MSRFRLPLKEYRDQMTIEQLETTSKYYTDWYFEEEEYMTERQANNAWAKKEELDAYIQRRKGQANEL